MFVETQMCRNPSRRKARLTSHTPSKAQRSGFVRKKEEGESIMEFLSKNKNEMARTSLLPRPPSKAQRSGFAWKKEEGESIMEFSPQGGNGTVQVSLSPPSSEQSPAKRVCEEKGRRREHNGVFTARWKRNGASFFTPPVLRAKPSEAGLRGKRKKERA